MYSLKRVLLATATAVLIFAGQPAVSEAGAGAGAEAQALIIHWVNVPWYHGCYPVPCSVSIPGESGICCHLTPN